MTGPGLRVLVVEDDVTLAKVLTYFIAERGHQCVVVRDVASALSALLAGAFDVVVSDKCVRDGSGIDVLRCAQQKWSSARRILISGSEPEQSDQSLSHEYLEKPFSLERILCAIERQTLLHEVEVRRRTGAEVASSSGREQLADGVP